MSDSQPASKATYHVSIFHPKDLGRSMKEVAVEVLRLEAQDVESRWFHSNKDADLYIWKDQRGNVVKQQISFYGTLMEWNIVEGVRTGFILEDESSQGIDKSPMIQYDTVPQRNTVEQGVEIVGYIEGLNLEDKHRIIENFATSPVFDTYSVKELIAKFGIPPRQSTSLWQRLYKLLGLGPKSK